jgi:hypothetical protein
MFHSGGGFRKSLIVAICLLEYKYKQYKQYKQYKPKARVNRLKHLADRLKLSVICYLLFY